MNWFAQLENPKALLAYYEVAPSLEGSTVHSLCFHRDGPAAELVLDLKVFPSSPSPRWPKGSNKCQITLRLDGLSSVELSCWGTGVVGNLEISHQGGGVNLKFSGDASFRLHGSWLYVVSVTGYINGEA